MSIYDLKPRFQNLLRPLCARLADRGITPNQVTLAALALSAASGAWIAIVPASRAALLWLPAALFFRMALNAIDGMLAREHDMRSRAGALLNELGDVISDALLYLPFARIPGVPPPLIVIAIVLAGLTETAGIAAVQLGAERNYRGPMGKSDRAFVFGLLAFLVGLGIPTGPWSDGILVVVILLLMLTVWNRCRTALEEPE